MAHPGGRPTDYTPELIERAWEYVNNLPESEVIHSLEGLALYIGISRPTLYEWEKDENKTEFSNIVQSVRNLQARALVNKGLSGDYNPTIAKVILSKHGYSEKQEIDHTTKGEAINDTGAVKDLTQKLNELYRGTSISSDGGSSSFVGTQTQSKE